MINVYDVLEERGFIEQYTNTAACRELAEKPAGQNGFGYDPIFYYPPLNKTFAQLTREEKSRVSHRGKALRELRGEFDKVLIWIGRHMSVQERIDPPHPSQK